MLRTSLLRPRTHATVLVAVAILCTTSLSHAARAAQSAALVPAWIGCWGTGDGGSGGPQVRLEPERCTWREGDKLSFHRLTSAGDHVRLERWSRLRELDLSVKDGRLVVLEDGQETILERLDEVPASLLLEPYELPEVEPLDADTVAFIAADLLERETEDQRVRGEFTRSASFDSALAGEMNRIDTDNTEFLVTLIGELGWIDALRFDRRTADAAFLLVQHSSDLRLMCTALPHIETDVRAGRLGGQAFALLFDRLQLNLGYSQRYGSQLSTMPSGETVLMPCEDLAQVDERRKELGIGPLAEYLTHFQEEGDGPVRTLAEALRAPRAEPASAEVAK